MQKESLTVTTLWRGSESRICHSEKELEVARREGFAEYNAADHEYPRWVYRGQESVIVNSKEEERTRVAEGFSRTATVNNGVIPEAPTASTTAAPKDVALGPAGESAMLAIIANHGAQIADLASRVAELEGRKPAKGGKKSKDDDQE